MKNSNTFKALLLSIIVLSCPDAALTAEKYDALNHFIKNYIDMPDKQVDLLIRFLNQNDGKLSKRARDKEFGQLTDAEIRTIEHKYTEIF